MHLALRRILLAGLVVAAARAADFDLARSTNQVGLDLYRRLAAERPTGNLVLSPYSLESALTLAYAGADGATREEMSTALHFPADRALMATQARVLRVALDGMVERSRQSAERKQELGGNEDIIQWQVANRLYGQEGYAFRPEFLRTMESDYGAPFQPMDFKSAGDASRRTINDWVAGQTKGHIRDLIPKDGITPATRLTLVNALYLKAPWSSPFESRDTHRRPFHFDHDGTHNVPTMQQSGYWGYTKEKHATVVTLPYTTGELQFVIILPDEGVAPEAIVQSLMADDFSRWAKLGGRDDMTEVALFLPKFRVTMATLRIGAALRALGVRSAFDEPAGSANFDAIAPRRPGDYLALSEVFHQAFVSVDEEGTEAAAASAITTLTLGVHSIPSRPIEVHVDRPFLIAIQHRPTTACLLLGRISAPR